MTKQEHEYFYITISTLAYCIVRDCEKSLQLHFEKSKSAKTLNAIEKAYAESGTSFESRVMQLLGNAVIDHREARTTESVDILRHAEVDTILGQLPFVMPESFYTQNVYRFSKFIPDFLLVKRNPRTGHRMLSVVDSKYSSRIKLSHRIQIATYVYLLQYLVQDIDDLEVDRVGTVWLPSNLRTPLAEEAIEAIPFRVDIMLPKIKLFYESELQVILTKQTPLWIFNEDCKTCQFKDKCRVESVGTHSAVPNMTKRTIGHMKHRNKNSDSIDEVLALAMQEVTIEDAKPPLPEWMTSPIYKPYIQAYETKKPQFRGIPIMDIGEKSDHNVFVSLILDPQVRMICTYVIRVFATDGTVVEDLDCSENVSTRQQGKPAYVDLAISLVQDLLRVLDAMERSKSCCSIFLADSLSRRQLHTCLMQVASLTDIDEEKRIQAENAMRLLFALFPDEKILGIDNVPWYPAALEMVTMPRVVSIEDLVTKHVALGITGFYVLEDMLYWLCNDTSKFDLVDVFTCLQADQPIAHRLFDHCDKMLKVLEQFRNLAARFVQWTSKEAYCYKATPFVWPARSSFNSPTMGRLAYFVKYEHVMECKDIRAERINDARNEEKTGLYLRFTGREYVTKPSSKNILSFDVIVGEFESKAQTQVKVDTLKAGSTRREYLLVPDTHEGAMAAVRLKDMECNGSFYSKLHTLTNIKSTSKNPMRIVLDCKYLNGIRLKVGQNYRLYRRFMNGNTELLLNGVAAMDSNTARNTFEQIVQDPNAWSVHQYDDPPDKVAAALERRSDFGMSQSQGDISGSIIQKRLQIVWGPPGSGKTTFLALFITWYLTHMHPKGEPCIIGVTAHTRHAIMNLLKAIDKTARKYGIDAFDMLYANAGSGSDDARKNLPNVPRCLSSKMEKKLKQMTRPTVIGGTTWDFLKLKKNIGADFKCGMVFIDEGSQLSVPEAGIVIDCLDAHKGRLIVVGDHMQLGPILKSRYPKTEPPFHGSIQECLMRTDDNASIKLDQLLLNNGESLDFGPNTAQLKDNWRSNDDLSAFYRPVYGNGIIAHFPNQRLSYDWTGVASNRRITAILDPQQAITVVNIPFFQRDYGRQNEIEAQVVGEVLEAHLRACQDTESEVMVITPHHKQRVSVEDQIQRRGLRRGKTRVDTVDKMQGQECSMVLACFTYNEVTEKDHEFLLDFRRWNVTLSRAKCKVVVFTTDTVLSLGTQRGLSFDLFDNASAIEGWVFICMLKDWVKQRRAMVRWQR